MCSAVADTCLTPFTFDEPYNSTYECMIDGYTKALEKTIELGKEDVNEYDIYIKFMCEKDNKLLI